VKGREKMIHELSLETVEFSGDFHSIIERLRVVSHHMLLEHNDGSEIFEGWFPILCDVIEDINTIDKALQADWDKRRDAARKKGTDA
jgi:hypothetical protein